MISFEFQKACSFEPTLLHKQWLKAFIRKEGLIPGDIDYVFCDDAYLLERNIHFLNHDTLTDIITFDYVEGNVVSGDILISVDRVKENADLFHTTFDQELHRVIIHGILHLLGQADKSEADAAMMRKKEESALALWNSMG